MQITQIICNNSLENRKSVLVLSAGERTVADCSGLAAAFCNNDGLTVVAGGVENSGWKLGRCSGTTDGNCMAAAGGRIGVIPGDWNVPGTAPIACS